MDSTSKIPALRAEMLGGFAIFSNGEQISVGKSAGAKFHSLLGMLILAGAEGLLRDDILDSLYGADSLANIGNSLNNLIYQARGHIERSDLPDGCGIIKRRERYFWKSDVPTVTDVDEFETLTAEAALTKDIESRRRLLKRAVALYKGALLSSVDGGWIKKRRDSLRQSYLNSLSHLADIYRQDGDTAAMISLYSKAENAIPDDPDGELSSALITALIDAGDKKTALKHYDRAVRKYQSQGRGNIPESLESCARRLSAKGDTTAVADLKSELIDVVSSDASEDGDDGAFYCNYPSFIDAVRLARRNLARDSRPATLMLLTLVDYEGKPIRMEKKRKLYSEALSDSIRGTLRTGDSFTRHDETGFLILLPGADEENAVAIYDRIAKNFRASAGANTGLRYRKLDLADL